MPYFHGHDVRELQQVLAVLGFACGPEDGIFGAFTELALRKFQTSLGLPSDGIAGCLLYTSKKMLGDTYDVYLGYNNPSSRCICAHYDVDPQLYADDPDAVWNIPFYPAGSDVYKRQGYRSVVWWERNQS